MTLFRYKINFYEGKNYAIRKNKFSMWNCCIMLCSCFVIHFWIFINSWNYFIAFDNVSKKEGGYGSAGGLETGILATVIGVIASILWIIVLINLANICL